MNSEGTIWGLTQFADMSQEEFSQMLGFGPVDFPLLNSLPSGRVEPSNDLPESVDWRT